MQHKQYRQANKTNKQINKYNTNKPTNKQATWYYWTIQCNSTIQCNVETHKQTNNQCNARAAHTNTTRRIKVQHTSHVFFVCLFVGWFGKQNWSLYNALEDNAIQFHTIQCITTKLYTCFTSITIQSSWNTTLAKNGP